MNRVVYLNGSFVAEQEATLFIDDGGWLHGAGLFETVGVVGRRPFRYEQHIRRLMNSAARLLRPIDRTDLPVMETVQALLERNELDAARLRLTVSAGRMRDQAEGSEKLTVCMTASPLVRYAERLYHEGIQVMISGFKLSPTDPLAGHKTTCHFPKLIALREARAADCLEALWFTTQGHLAEGCISNVFLVAGERLRTPPLDTPVLPGVARDVVINLARDQGMVVEEAPLVVDDLLDAEEVFLTNAIMRVLPVVRIERHVIGGGEVGQHTKALMWAFDEHVREACGHEEA